MVSSLKPQWVKIFFTTHCCFQDLLHNTFLFSRKKLHQFRVILWRGSTLGVVLHRASLQIAKARANRAAHCSPFPPWMAGKGGGSGDDKAPRDAESLGLGWLAQSAAPAKRQRLIQGVGAGSLLELKAQYYRSQEEVRWLLCAVGGESAYQCCPGAGLERRWRGRGEGGQGGVARSWSRQGWPVPPRHHSPQPLPIQRHTPATPLKHPPTAGAAGQGGQF